jgi:ferric-dicitrate binding protein FerR (iron transport regulator)
MNCDRARTLLSAYVDRQLEPVEQAAIEEHLRECADCRTALDAARDLDSDLRRVFEAPRGAAGRVAEQVASRLPRVAEPRVLARQQRRLNWISIALAAAIGFIAALLVFPPGKARGPIAPMADRPAEGQARVPPTADTPVARLILATATDGLEYHDQTRKEWQPVAPLSQFQCPSEGSVRTDENVRCELVTADGCVVRMNCGTEVVFHSADKVELKRGEIWCRSTPQTALEVRPSLAAGVIEHNRQGAQLSPFCCTAVDATCLLRVSRSGDEVQVTAAAGNVSVKAMNESRQLKPSETATMTHDRIDQVRATDRLLAASWMEPLLILKGRADAELAQRIDDLLARVGQSKVSNLYEDEIRRLGEYSVLPLLRYVQSPRSSTDAGRRLVAIRIASDLAPPWAIGDLIDLLRHSDPDVRCLAAAALARLTQQDQGLTIQDWRDAPAKWQPAVDAWQSWWVQNKSRYPMRLEGSLRAGPSERPADPKK